MVKELIDKETGEILKEVQLIERIAELKQARDDSNRLVTIMSPDDFIEIVKAC